MRSSELQRRVCESSSDAELLEILVDQVSVFVDTEKESWARVAQSVGVVRIAPKWSGVWLVEVDEAGPYLNLTMGKHL